MYSFTKGEIRGRSLTIAISVKVIDGVVLASDSASTIFQQQTPGGPAGVVNVYYNADKVYNLCKGVPLGAITWGMGSIGQASISTLMKDFRKTVMASRTKKSYMIEDVAKDLAGFMFDRYQEAFSKAAMKSLLGFMVAGYSTEDDKQHDFAEEWIIHLIDGNLEGPNPIRRENEAGITWNGEPEAITRLYLRHRTGTANALQDLGLSSDEAKRIAQGLRDRLSVPMVIPPMPIQDAIDLARFLCRNNYNFSKFAPGAPTVGGPVDIATITKHEGFKWVQRKHYFSQELNPSTGGD